MIGLGHFQRALEGLLHLRLEPVFHAVGDKSRSHKEEKNRGDEGEADKGDHQPGPEPCPEDPALPLENQLHQISDHQKDQEEDENDVDIDQTEDKDVVGKRDRPPGHLRNFHLDGCEDNNQNGGDSDDDQLVAASFCLRG